MGLQLACELGFPSSINCRRPSFVLVNQYDGLSSEWGRSMYWGLSFGDCLACRTASLFLLFFACRVKRVCEAKNRLALASRTSHARKKIAKINCLFCGLETAKIRSLFYVALFLTATHAARAGKLIGSPYTKTIKSSRLDQSPRSRYWYIC